MARIKDRITGLIMIILGFGFIILTLLNVLRILQQTLPTTLSIHGVILFIAGGLFFIMLGLLFLSLD